MNKETLAVTKTLTNGGFGNIPEASLPALRVPFSREPGPAGEILRIQQPLKQI